MGRDADFRLGLVAVIVFQSTRPVWGATCGPVWWKSEIARFQSTRPVWGATNFSGHNAAKFIIFQSTRPVWGATTELSRVTERKVFQSTRPVWGATARRKVMKTEKKFQSTRPVWGATTVYQIIRCLLMNFNPRAPCGARPPMWVWLSLPSTRFQSTRPVWGATQDRAGGSDLVPISIHAPRVGRDENGGEGSLVKK